MEIGAYAVLLAQDGIHARLARSQAVIVRRDAGCKNFCLSRFSLPGAGIIVRGKIMVGAVSTMRAMGINARPVDGAPPAFAPPVDGKPSVVAGAPSTADTTELLYSYVSYFRKLAQPSRHPNWAESNEERLVAYNERIVEYFKRAGHDEAGTYAKQFMKALGSRNSRKSGPIDANTAFQYLSTNSYSHAWQQLSDQDLHQAQTPLIRGLAAYCLSQGGGERVRREREVLGMLNGLGPTLGVYRQEAFVQNAVSAVNALESVSPLRNRPPR